MPAPAPRRRAAAAPLLAALALALAALAPARAEDKIEVNYCTDASCGSCTQWQAASGACTPGSMGSSSWPSFVSTMEGGWGGDRRYATVVVFANASCAAGWAVGNVTLRLDGACYPMGPPFTGGFLKGSSPAMPWVVAVIVIFGVVVPIGLLCCCCRYCCCKRPHNKTVSSMTPAEVGAQPMPAGYVASGSAYAQPAGYGPPASYWPPPQQQQPQQQLGGYGPGGAMLPMAGSTPAGYYGPGAPHPFFQQPPQAQDYSAQGLPGGGAYGQPPLSELQQQQQMYYGAPQPPQNYGGQQQQPNFFGGQQFGAGGPVSV